jgi:hypothetical protein
MRIRARCKDMALGSVARDPYRPLIHVNAQPAAPARATRCFDDIKAANARRAATRPRPSARWARSHRCYAERAVRRRSL